MDDVKKLTAEFSTNPPLQAISDILSTKKLHSTLLDMNNSIKLLHHEVMFLRAKIVLKSEADKSVYKTLTNELEVAQETDHSLRQSKNIIFGWTTGQTRSFIDKLTSVIPSLGFRSLKQVHPIGYWGMLISKPFSQIQLNSKCTSEPNEHPKRSVRNEKPVFEKQLATPIYGSKISQTCLFGKSFNQYISL